MKIFIDADGCPVVNETVELCKKTDKECIIICDTAHSIEKDGAQTIVVEKGSDSVDFKLVNLILKLIKVFLSKFSHYFPQKSVVLYPGLMSSAVSFCLDYSIVPKERQPSQFHHRYHYICNHCSLV